jgi:predicted Zn finger-like uncharacterized protein
MAKISLVCPKCKTLFKVEEINIGKRGRCQKCGEVFVISQSQETKNTALSDAQSQIEATQPTMPQGTSVEKISQSICSEPKVTQPIEATIKQDISPNVAGTILSPRAERADNDIAATMAAPAQKGASEIQVAEQNVAAEWEEGQTILDLYEVKKVHTGGGMGLVYKVHHKNWNMDLAVKSPRTDFFKTESQKENFIKECETWINLGLHPNIVSCYYVRTLGGIPRVFAEYVEGGSLKDWIDNRKLYEEGKEKALERILDIAIQFAWGLHYAHEHEEKLVHQDVKPANVMMTNDGEAKVTDFGLARARTVTGEAISSGLQRSILVSSGGMTPAYCSPEQANKQLLSRKTDIWSWGLSVLEMFAGEVFWRAGQAASEAFESFLQTGTKDGSVAKMPNALIELLKQCFQRNPDDRPKDMQGIAGKLKEIYQQITGQEYSRPEPKPADLLADGLNNKAVSMLDLGKKEKAEKLYNEALKTDPHHLEAIYNRGLLLWRSCRMTDDEMVRQLEEVRTTHLNDWKDEYLLGIVHLERGDAESAEKVLAEAASQAPGDERVQSSLTDARHGAMERKGRTLVGHKAEVSSVSISFDGKWALSGCAGDKMICLWNLESGECKSILKDCDSVGRVFIDTQGSLGVSDNVDGTLYVWDLETDNCTKVLGEHLGGVCCICMNSNGRFLLSGDENLHLLDLTTGKCIRTYEGHRDSIFSGSVTADGQLALSGSKDNTLRLWNLTSGECLRVFQGHEKSQWGIWSVSISADGRFGLSGGDDKTVRLWNINTGECLNVLTGHTARVSSVSISMDGSMGLSGSPDGTIRLWELATGRCLRTSKGRFGPLVCVDANNLLAITANEDRRKLSLWDMRLKSRTSCPTVLCLPRNAAEISGQASVVREAIEKAKLTTMQGRPWDAYEDIRRAKEMPGYERNADLVQISREIGFYGRRTGLRGAWLLRRLEGHENSVNCVRVLEEGRSVISGSSDGTIRLWEISTGKCLRILKGHTGDILALCTNEDGCLALSGGKDSTIRLWNLSTGNCEQIFEGHTNEVYSVCISRDSRWMLSGGCDETLRLWDLGQRKCIETFKKDKSSIYSKDMGSIRSVCFSDDGCWAICPGFGERALIWDLADKKIISSFKGHMASVFSVAITYDSRYLLCGIMDPKVPSYSGKTLYVWEVATGKCLRKLEGHPGDVPGVIISADDQWVISAGCGDRTVRLWELATGKCLRVFQGHQGPVYSVDMTRDCHWLVSSSRDMTICVWELDWDYEFPAPANWDEGARRYIENYLIRHCPIGEDGISRIGKPVWGEDDFKKLLQELKYRGYGWLRPEGVKKELEDMTANWQGIPADWDRRAQPYLENFLKSHSKKNWLGRWNTPVWDEKSFKELLMELRSCGYGWLRSEGVRKKLEEMTANWRESPPSDAWKKYSQNINVPNDITDNETISNMRFHFTFKSEKKKDQFLSSLSPELSNALNRGHCWFKGTKEGMYHIAWDRVCLNIDQGKDLMNRVVSKRGEIYEAFLT